MSRASLTLHSALSFICLACAANASAQQIRIYSEFQRFDPFGNVVPYDRDMVPREILSPAVPRNGHLSVHIVVTAPAGTNYFLYAASNPPDILELTLYREHFVRCGTGFCPDWLTRINSEIFGAIPESILDPALRNQTSRSYLLDIRVRGDTPPRRVRVEALLKTGTWLVAPLEVRIVAPVIPDISPNVSPAIPIAIAGDLAPLEASASSTAQRQLLRYLAGQSPEFPGRILRLRDITQRNAAEDMLLARALAARRGGATFPEMNLLAWWPLTYPEPGAEWYLRVRDFLNRFDP